MIIACVKIDILKGNILWKNFFPKNTNPSNFSVNIHFLDSDYHEHKLVYCRSSRHFTFYNRERFHNNK